MGVVIIIIWVFIIPVAPRVEAGAGTRWLGGCCRGQGQTEGEEVTVNVTNHSSPRANT